MSDIGGVWRTIAGRKVFIKDGQSLSEAMKESKKFENFQSLLGKEFKGLKGKDAIEKLLKEKNGHIKGAFNRDDIGDIDLIWGNSRMGLKHIIERREKTKQDIDKVLRNLEESISKGVPKLSRTKDGKLKIALEHKNQRVILGTEIQDNKIQFILTTYEINK